MEQKHRFIISGGGTGGHIFPAISIANALRSLCPEADIRFVGAAGRMEMEKVPAAGYPITGLPMQGLYRSFTPKNFIVLKNALKSLYLAKKLLLEFRPEAVIGVGGYASGPVLWQAASLGIPTLIQEQNSYAGLTNKLVARKCQHICVAYEGMERFFPADKIVLTGNPVRTALLEGKNKQEEAYQHFGLDAHKKTLLVVGGSLGARTINQSLLAGLEQLCNPTATQEIQIVWQTGSFYIDSIRQQLTGTHYTNLVVTDFISRMDLAYSIADLVVSRAGAGSISELALLGKACLLVPSPNVAEDHQTQNALALHRQGAAAWMSDQDAPAHLIDEALRLLHDDAALQGLRNAILPLAKPNASHDIAALVLKMAGIALPQPKRNSANKTAPIGRTKEKQPQQPKGNPTHSNTPTRRYFFLGIGGMGMSAIARFFKQQGYEVGGYDRTRSPLTEALESEGIAIHYQDNVSLIPVCYMDPEQTIVVYTPAIPADLKELDFFRQGKFHIYKRSEMLSLLTEGRKSLCVAGSHGKTTTTSLIAHLLRQSMVGCDAFLGGISKNYQSNLLTNSHSEYMVVEADEFDRSFLRLHPYMAVVTATDADHLDIYGTHEEMLKAFTEFTHLIQPGGRLIYKYGIALQPHTQENVQCLSYSLDDARADYYAEHIQFREGGLQFDFVGPKGRIDGMELGVPVLINVENAVAALAITTACGLTADEAKAGLASFQGNLRRFDVRFQGKGKVLIDDFAHHPNELKAAIDSIRRLYPGKKICGIFQPHLYSRTRDFYPAFGESLSALDEVILLDIYPARERPIPKVTSQLIYKAISHRHKKLCRKEEVLDVLQTKNFDVLITLGAGDIDRLVAPIQAWMETQFQ